MAEGRFVAGGSHLDPILASVSPSDQSNSLLHSPLWSLMVQRSHRNQLFSAQKPSKFLPVMAHTQAESLGYFHLNHISVLASSFIYPSFWSCSQIRKVMCTSSMMTKSKNPETDTSSKKEKMKVTWQLFICNNCKFQLVTRSCSSKWSYRVYQFFLLSLNAFSLRNSSFLQLSRCLLHKEN